MPYQVLHIPFAQGQHEGFDKKVLPVGPMRSVYNMRLERDGRMARRQQLRTKTPYDVDGTVADNLNYDGFVEPNLSLVRDESAPHGSRLRAWVHGPLAETNRLVSGRIPSTTRIEQFYSAQQNYDPSQVGWTAHQTGEYRSQLFPQVDIDVNGRIITAQLQGNTITVDIRDPETMAPVKTVITLYAGREVNSQAMTFKMVASKVTARYALLVYDADLGLSTPGIFARVFKSDGDFGEVYSGEDSRLTTAGGFTFDTNSFDAIARPDVDTFIMAYQDGDGGDLKLTEWSFASLPNLASGADLDTFAYVAGTFGPVVSVDCDESRWVWTHAGDATGDPDAFGRSGEWGSATVTVKDFGEAWVTNTGALMVKLVSRTRAVIVKSCLDGGGSIDRPRVEVIKWAIDANSYSTVSPPDPIVGDQSLGDILPNGNGWVDIQAFGYPIVEGGITGVVRFMGYYAQNYKTAASPGHIVAVDLSGDNDTGDIWIDAAIHKTGVDYRTWTSGAFEPGKYQAGHLPRPLAYTTKGVDYVIWPAAVDVGRAEVTGSGDTLPTTSAVWSRTSRYTARAGKELRIGESLIPGGVLSAFDGDRCLLAGFMGPPDVYVNASVLGVGDVSRTYDNKEWSFAAVMEYTDANGRVWVSAPSPIFTETTSTVGDDTNESWGYTIDASFPVGLAGQENGAQLAIYCTNVSEPGESLASPMYRRWVFDAGQGKRFRHSSDDGTGPQGYPMFSDAPTGVETPPVLYTTSGEVGNDPPPACEMLATTRSRVWAAGLPERSWIQASKPLNDTQGVHWSNLDNFRVFMPDEVTGIAAMDDSLVAFTRDKVYAVHGEGPDSGGIGAFSEPQLIPGSSGCINHLSVVSTEAGVFYQSLRGLELVPRGLASPQWAGETVRDTLKLFPVCKGVCESPTDWTVRWLFNNSEETDSRVVVHDLRVGSWYVFDYNEYFTSIGLCLGADGDSKHTAMFLSRPGRAVVEEQRDPGYEALSSDEAWLETGSLRVAGLQAWAFGRRVNLLGGFGGRDCSVTIQMAFNDEDWLAEDQFTWRLTEDEYGEDVPVELELTLPVQQFSSVRFRIKVLSNSNSSDGKYTFKPNGMSVYYSTAGEGPRLAARNTG